MTPKRRERESSNIIFSYASISHISFTCLYLPYLLSYASIPIGFLIRLCFPYFVVIRLRLPYFFVIRLHLLQFPSYASISHSFCYTPPSPLVFVICLRPPYFFVISLRLPYFLVIFFRLPYFLLYTIVFHTFCPTPPSPIFLSYASVSHISLLSLHLSQSSRFYRASSLMKPII